MTHSVRNMTFIWLWKSAQRLGHAFYPFWKTNRSNGEGLVDYTTEILYHNSYRHGENAGLDIMEVGSLVMFTKDRPRIKITLRSGHM